MSPKTSKCRKSLVVCELRKRLIHPAGKYDVWTERGKADGFHLFIGNKKDDEAPRLRAMFRLYEREEGVAKLTFKLKLTRRATKLKFSLFAGKSEGHGNLRIVEDAPKE